MADKQSSFTVSLSRMMEAGLKYGSGNRWDRFPHEGLDVFVCGNGEEDSQNQRLTFWATCNGGPADGFGSRYTLFLEGDSDYGPNEQALLKFLASVVSFERPELTTDEAVLKAVTEVINKMTDGGKSDLSTQDVISYVKGKSFVGVHKLKQVPDRDGTKVYKTSITAALPKYRFDKEAKPHKKLSPYIEAEIASQEQGGNGGGGSMDTSALREGSSTTTNGSSRMDAKSLMSKLAARG